METSGGGVCARLEKVDGGVLGGEAQLDEPKGGARDAESLGEVAQQVVELCDEDGEEGRRIRPVPSRAEVDSVSARQGSTQGGWR